MLYPLCLVTQGTYVHSSMITTGIVLTLSGILSATACRWSVGTRTMIWCTSLGAVSLFSVLRRRVLRGISCDTSVRTSVSLSSTKGMRGTEGGSMRGGDDVYGEGVRTDEDDVEDEDDNEDDNEDDDDDDDDDDGAK